MRATGAARQGGRKRAHSRRGAPVSVAPPLGAAPEAARELAGFAMIEVPPADAQKWLVHPFVWLQPELLPSLPASSGLWVERRHKIPMPGFAGLEIAAAERRKGAQEVVPASRSEVPLKFPESDLAPLGWDPRTLATNRKGPQ